MLLLFELVLFAVILILPQVDLPDFTFHKGTAPVAVHVQASSPPVRTVSRIVVPVLQVLKREPRAELRYVLSPPSLGYRLSSLCTLLC
jgi:hypothetical protein